MEHVFFAFFLVFLVHCFVSVDSKIGDSSLYQSVEGFFKVGFLGVDYFFVLSGFLISWVILNEKEKTKKFGFGNFFTRRVLRIWPLYFLIIFLGYGTYYASISYGVEIAGLPPFYNFTLFIVNFYSIYEGVDYLFFLTFLWSISIEEQFYIGYSIIAKLFFKLNLLVLAVILILISLLYRYLHLENGQQLYFHTCSVLGNFGVGILVAYIAQQKNSVFSWLENRSNLFSGVIYFVLFGSLIYYNELNEIDPFRVVSRLYFSLLFGYIIFEQCFSKHRFLSFGKNRVITYLGKISFGLYCYHGVVITILIKTLERLSFDETLWHVFIIYPIIVLVLSIGLSALSYKYFEGFFLKFKKRFAA